MMDAIGSTINGARIMYYCHDTFGLGHLRRTLTLANHVRRAAPNLSQLIVTGSPVANRFGFPAGTDYVKLPSVTKNDRGAYEPRSLPGNDMSSVRNMRQDILLAAARNFQPDFFVVDHAPGGLQGEVIATLRHLKEEFPETRLIVGLRDIMDEAATVRKSWAREGVYELFDDFYDLILVYGNRAFYDVVNEYGLSLAAAEKTRFVGYLGRDPGARSRTSIRASLDMQTDKLVVVTAGGGGDGRTIFEAMLRDLQISDQRDFDCLIVGGPLIPDTDRTELRTRLGGRGNVHFLDFTDDLPSYIGAADAVISMGGYNTVCEILSLNRPALIVPRVKPRQEQLIRATVLSGRGLVDMIHPRDLEPERLLTSTLDLLARASNVRPVLTLDGLPNVVTELDSLMSGAATAMRSA
ncbi:MAG: glycosyltransferase [Chloroflexota bacterium]|nr:glycosyltransferase [Chloroflexia bacterium]MDQ3443916.1 glycosyltransferase [Chloroflexota bacterium]